jgi:hypothetical protein
MSPVVDGGLSAGPRLGVRVVDHFLVAVGRPHEQGVVPLVPVLDGFDAQESEAAGNGEQEQPDAQAALVELGGPHGKGHGEAAGDEDDGVDEAQVPLELGVTVEENLRVVGAPDGVGDEETAEHEDFGGQEDPHADLGRVELLAWGVEVVGQVGRVFVDLVFVGRLGGGLGHR